MENSGTHATSLNLYSERMQWPSMSDSRHSGAILTCYLPLQLQDATTKIFEDQDALFEQITKGRWFGQELDSTPIESEVNTVKVMLGAILPILWIMGKDPLWPVIV